MDPFTFIAAVLLSALLAFFLTRPSFPNLPGPPLRDYIPGGIANIIYADSSRISETLKKLTDKHGEIFQLWLGPHRTIVSSVPGDIAHILGSQKHFERPTAMINMFENSIPGSLFTMQPDVHLSTRRKLRDNFNYSMLPDFHNPMIDAINELVHFLSSHATASSSNAPSDIIDINSMLSTVTYRVILNVAFGFRMDYESRLHFGHVADLYTQALLSEVLEYPIRQMLTPFGIRRSFFNCKRIMDNVVRKLIDERINETSEAHSKRKPDLLDALLNLHGKDSSTIVSQAVLFSIAGAHTTNLSIGWCLYYAAQSPRITKRIVDEVDAIVGDRSSDDPITPDDVAKLVYLNKVWKEALRLCAPGNFFLRVAQVDTTLRGSGVKIAKGTQIAAFSHHAHTNSKYWDEPHEFIPERWGTADEPGEGDKVPPGAYVPFSIGPTNCAGQFFADYEGVLILAELFRRFKFSPGCEAHEVVMTSGWLEVGRYSSKKGGKLDMGIPLRVQCR